MAKLKGFDYRKAEADLDGVGAHHPDHNEHAGKVLLFVREFKQDACGTAPYTFLGTADYVSHQAADL